MQSTAGVLPAQVERALGDKLYEKRKTAALEIEKMVRESADLHRIEQILGVLVAEFAYSTLPNSRNGGLIALAACAIALGPRTIPHLPVLVPPILACLADHDARVRYYACESMYNVAKVARAAILFYFNDIFNVLTKLAVDVESSVKNGAELLDRLMKDIVTEKAVYHHPEFERVIALKHNANNILGTAGNLESRKSEDKDALGSRENAQSKIKSALSQDALVVVDNLGSNIKSEGINDNVKGISEILDKNKLEGSKENNIKDVVLNATKIEVAEDFLLKQKNLTGEDAKSTQIIPGLYPPVPGSTPLRPGVSANSFNLPRFAPLLAERIKIISVPGRIFLVQWIFVLNSIPDLELVSYLPQFLDGLFVFLSDANIDVRTATLNVLGEFLKEMQSVVLIQQATGPLKLSVLEAFNPETQYISGQGVSLQFAKISMILVKHLSSADETIQITALRWMHELIIIAPRSETLPFTSKLIASIIPIFSQPDTQIREAAVQLNNSLHSLVLQSGSFDCSETVAVLMSMFLGESSKDTQGSRVGTLDWLIMLHKTYPDQIINEIELQTGIFKMLSDSEDVAKRALQLLAQISKNSDDQYFNNFIRSLLEMLKNDRRLLETRGSLIIRQLCQSLDSERLFRSLGEIIEPCVDLEFASTIVQHLNLILITAPEVPSRDLIKLSEVRKRLKNLDSKDGMSIFTVLYRSWCHSAVSVFALCLLSQTYDQAASIMSSFSEIEITVTHLVQLDKLVQLIESPVFTSLRLHLLEPDKHPSLYKSLFGILMILPQSSAFEALRNRLNSVNSLVLLQVSQQQRRNSTGISNVSKEKDGQAKWTDFLQHFRSMQLLHSNDGKAMKSGSLNGSSKKNRPPQLMTGTLGLGSMSSIDKKRK